MNILFENQTKSVKYHLIYILVNEDNPVIQHGWKLINKLSLRKILFFGIIVGKIKDLTVLERYQWMSYDLWTS